MYDHLEYRSWVELLQALALAKPDQLAFAHLQRSNSIVDSMTYAQLERRARVVAHRLKETVGDVRGERVVIALSSGNAYICAFFGVLFAGGTPVTAYPPKSTGNLSRLSGIGLDCRPIATIGDESVRQVLGGSAAATHGGTLLIAGELSSGEVPDSFVPARLNPGDLALLQYTSGSTSDPRGVMVSHANLFHNCDLMRRGMAFDANSIVASWLPLHHDMGLIGKILTSLYCGVPCYYIAPTAFAKAPVLWLEMISKYRCTISGAPNFAYDLCVRRVGEEDRARLNLESWRVAWNGAEPVRTGTLAEFRRAFAGSGLRLDALRPCYGLAEATLFVTSRGDGLSPESIVLDREALAAGMAREARASGSATTSGVSVGSPRHDTVVKIVDPEARTECPEGAVGELWTSSASVAQGYWGRVEESALLFGATLAGDSGGDAARYLRTGDLAFRLGDEFYIAGRLKDTLIINGRNVYPQDVEESMERAAPTVRRSVLAGATAPAGGELPVAICEVDRAALAGGPAAFDEIVSRVVASAREDHDLMLSRLVLVRPASIALTTSGKVQRRATLMALSRGEIEPILDWRPLGAAAAAAPVVIESGQKASKALAFKRALGRVLAVREEQLTGERRIAELGLDSIKLVELQQHVASATERQIDQEELLGGNPPLAELVKRLWSDLSSADIESVFPVRPSALRVTGAPRVVANKYQQRVHNADHPFVSAMNPEFGRKLSQLKLDKEFVSARGSYLYDADGKAYLDFISQYGALPLGHNHPDVWDEVFSFHGGSRAALVQPSFQAQASRLAARLVELAPKSIDYVTFCNSGAEAVEAALKVARSATGRLNVLATKTGFHGKTLGALSTTGREKYRRHFGVVRNEFDHVPFNDLYALRKALSQRSYACFVVEAIQGEAGAMVGEAEYLSGVERLCREAGTLFVLDEVQTGLGRTGYVFAAERYGLLPDVITLAKGLGGGLLPIGACLSGRHVYTDEFGNKHTSTFAGNGLACAVGARVLEVLTRDDGALLRHVRETGARLKAELLGLQRAFPSLVREVRGEGLMLALKLGIDRYRFGSGLLASIGEEEFITSLLMSYMLNRESVRTAFTLNDGNVLRIQPCLNVTWEECSVFIAALRRTLMELSKRHMGRLVQHLVDGRVSPSEERESTDFLRPSPASATPTFAFLLHPLTPRTYVSFDRSLGGFDLAQLEQLGGIFGDNFEPFLGGESEIVSAAGAGVTGEFWVLPRTARDLLAMPREQALEEVQQAFDLAVAKRPKVVGLGAYTSTISHGGLLLDVPDGVAVTTGNSLTAVVGFASVIEALSRRGRSLEESCVAVIGATGSVGRALGMLFGAVAKEVVLVGNAQRPEASLMRLEAAREVSHRMRDEIRQRVEASRLLLPPGSGIARTARRAARTVFELDWNVAASRADVVITATSSPDAMLLPGVLKPHAIVCDISRPSNVSPLLRSERPDVFSFDGGVVSLPKGRRLGMKTDLESATHCYACMAETMLLAMEDRLDLANVGQDVAIDAMFSLLEIASRHGFSVYVPAAGAAGPLLAGRRAAWSREASEPQRSA